MFGESIAQKLKERFPEAVTEIRSVGDQSIAFVGRESIVEVCRALHDDFGYVYLSDLTAVDLYDTEPRFNVVYNLYSFEDNDWLRLKVPVFSADPQLPSVTEIWQGADWPEREVYDMFGITFTGHPNMTRILMPDDWNGHPLRKDYPLLGNAAETVLLFDDPRDVLKP